MIYYQKWKKDTFEYKYLSSISKKIKKNPKIKCYIGFDFGFFHGTNIFYNSEKGYEIAKKINDYCLNNNLDIRLCTNIPYNYDLIILLGYTNLKKEQKYLLQKKKIFVKAFSFFL